ncbi:MAG: N-acetylmuramate alpha-1-phosphate uridylyltransferase MurU [Gammaproteobacteria bacterium]
MKAMILAAGRGERLRPYTDWIPKPLLKVGEKRLIEYHIEALVDANIHQIVINYAYMGDKIVSALGDGSRYGAEIIYSAEDEQGLETGGGIYHALPMLGRDPFIVINGDIWTDYNFAKLTLEQSKLAHLVLIDNPPFHGQGDFVIDNGNVVDTDGIRMTFSGMGVYHPDLFSGCKPGRFPLAPVLRNAMKKHCVSGEYYQGQWMDVGSPQRLVELQRLLKTD